MRLNYINIFSLVCGLGLLACEPEIDDIPTASNGEADFSTYVALGNSLTAGYADNALYLESQQNSYPSIIADQFAEVGGGAFVQPLVPAGNGANSSGQGKLVLSLASGSPSPVPTEMGNGVFDKVTGPFNNFGVPGAKAIHLLAPGYGSEMGNPFFARFATSASTTILQDAIARNPTFFTLWIGNNDVLGYATSGGEGDEITEVGAFNSAIDGIIAGLKSSNGDIEGAIANIPNVAKIPYFTTVPWNAFALESQEQVDQLNAAFSMQIEAGVKDAVEEGALEQITFGVATQVVTEQVRTTVAQGVVSGFIYQREYAIALASGATNDEADAEATAYLGSMEGQAELSQTVGAVLSEDPPAEVSILVNLVNQTMESEEIKTTISLETDNLVDAINADMLPPDDLAELNEAIDSVFNTEETQAGIALELGTQIEALKAAGFYPQFQVGPNGFVVEVDEEFSPTGLKQITADEKMLLPFASVSEEDFNPAAGLVVVPDRYALDASELAAIEAARTAYNDKLKATAESEGFAFVDMAGFFDQVTASPLLIGGVTYSTTFVTGNVFSLDGVHLTQAGAAIVANEFINSINDHYDAAVPPVANINAYGRVTLP